MALEKFNWQNGSQVEPAKVEIEGVSYDVVDAQYEGETPLSAANLNLMQDTLLSNVKDNLEDESKIPNCKAVKDIYSTDEVKTNKIWFGKPIYRKVFISNSNTKVEQISLSNLNIEEAFFDFSHSYYNANGLSRKIPIVTTHVSSSTDNVNALASNQHGIFFALDNSSFTIEIAYSIAVNKKVVTIEYTKTTD